MYINIDQLKTDANQPETFLNLLPDLTPVKRGRSYRFKESSGLSLFTHQSGTVILNNFSDKLDLPSGDIWTVTAKLYGYDTSTADGVKQTAATIASAAGLPFDNYTTDNTYTTPVKPRKAIKTNVPEWKPNKERKKHTSATYKLASKDAPERVRMLEYFKAKGDINAHTLDKYGVKCIESTTNTKGRTFNYTGENFAFIFKAGENIKRKQPTNSEYKELYIQSTGNYCFGYDQLPDTGAAVIIAAGESDTLAINDKAKQTGIYAICLNSETTTIPDTLINDLNKRFTRVMALFDNDNTGHQQTEKTRVQGIPATHIGQRYEVNDLCDAIEKHGAPDVMQWIEYISYLQVKPTNTDAYGNLFFNDTAAGHPDQWHEYNVQKYIDPDRIIQALKYNDRLLIDAPTGTGKTTAILQLAKQSDTRVIIAVPTVSIAKQLDKAAQAAGIHTNLIYGKVNEMEYMAAIGAPLFICTYNALQNINVSFDTLVIDEQHLCISEYGYRAKALSYATDAAAIADKVIYLSGTPNYNLSGWKLLKFKPQERQQMNIVPVYYENGNAAGAAEWIARRHPHGTHIIKKNDTGQLDAMSKELDKLNRSNVVFSNKKESKQTPEYQRLIDGNVNEEFILTTCLLETGVSIADQIDTVSILNPKDAREVMQMAARPRMNDGKNESITVYLFIKLGKKDTPPDTTKPHEFSPIDGNFITRYKAFAEANAAAANLTRQSEVKIPYADQYIRYSEINGKYICDTLGILHSFEKHVQTNSNAGDLLARCKAYGATIHDAINTDLNKVKKEATPDYKGEAAEIFRNETADAIGAIKYHTKSKDLSKALQSIRARNSHRAKELYEDKPIRNHLATFTRRLLELQTYTDTPQKHLIEIISKYTSTAKYRRISKQASAEYCMSNKATGEARVLGDKLQKLKDRVSFDGDQIEMTKHKAYELAKDLVPAARETLNLFEFLFNIKTKNKGEIWILSRPKFTAELAKFPQTENGAKSETPKNKRLNINGLEIVNSRKPKTVLYNRKKIAENL